jgi:hypothetical protein
LPSREALNALRALEPETEDLVEALESALAEVEGEWRCAKANVLDAEAAVLHEETAKRQARRTELLEEISVRQQEVHEHGNWIGNADPVRTQLLQAEGARRPSRRR